MKRYMAILTHNPQDYFEGKEPDSLVVTVEFYDLFNAGRIKEILNYIDNGYKAIIVPVEGDNSG